MNFAALSLAFLTALLAPPLAAETIRVATLLPYVADALDQLPGGVEVVASVPAELGESLPAGRIDLGNSHSPSFEMLVAARPDLVVGSRSVHAALAERLERTAPNIVMIETTSVDDTFAGLALVAETAGVSAEMTRLITATRRQLADLKMKESVSVLPLFGAPGAYMVITDRTWLGDLLDRLGFNNVAADLSGNETYPGYVELSEEVLATLEPDLVVLVTHGSPNAISESFAREAERGGVWANLADRIEVLEPSLFARNPGLAMVEAGRILVVMAQSTDRR